MAPEATRAVTIWLAVVYAMVLATVVIGGITRLTGSGLSMVEWHPLMGAVPPLSEASWNEVFAQYQSSPQYQKVNSWMTLADFKRIFFWEYLHRLSGRLIGVVFVLPWLYFVARGKLRGRLAWRSLVALLLGGLQGVLGWFMVKSGLVDVPAVSHYRLAAHFGLALLIGCYILWLLTDTLTEGPQREAPPPGLPRALAPAAWALVGLVGLQCVYGAFMAGTRAGYMYATFPTLNGRWFPPEAFAFEPFWRNVLGSPVGIHFFHRILGYLVALAVVAFAAVAWRRLPSGYGRRAIRALVPLVVLQIALGAWTVVFHMPLWAAALHQLGGVLLLSVALVAAHALHRRRVPQAPGHGMTRLRAQAVTPTGQLTPVPPSPQ